MAVASVRARVCAPMAHAITAAASENARLRIAAAKGLERAVSRVTDEVLVAYYDDNTRRDVARECLSRMVTHLEDTVLLAGGPDSERCSVTLEGLRRTLGRPVGQLNACLDAFVLDGWLTCVTPPHTQQAWFVAHTSDVLRCFGANVARELAVYETVSQPDVGSAYRCTACGATCTFAQLYIATTGRMDSASAIAARQRRTPTGAVIADPVCVPLETDVRGEACARTTGCGARLAPLRVPPSAADVHRITHMIRPLRAALDGLREAAETFERVRAMPLRVPDSARPPRVVHAAFTYPRNASVSAVRPAPARARGVPNFDVYIGETRSRDARLTATEWSLPRRRNAGAVRTSRRAASRPDPLDVKWFHDDIRADPERMRAVLKLGGRTLGCSCSAERGTCHGYVLVDLFNLAHYEANRPREFA